MMANAIIPIVSDIVAIMFTILDHAPDLVG